MIITKKNRIFTRLKRADHLVEQLIEELPGRQQPLLEELQSLLAQTLEEIVKPEKRVGDNSKEKTQEPWFGTARRYRLKELSKGVWVYEVKGRSHLVSLDQYYCPNCFERQKISMLQIHRVDERGDLYVCPSCKAEILDHKVSRQKTEQTRAASDWLL